MRALDGEPARSFFVACFLLRRVGALRVVKSVGDEDGGVGWFGLRSVARRVLLGLRGRRRGQQVLVDSRLHLLSDSAPPPLFNLGSFADCAHLRTPPFNRQSLTSQLERPSFLT